MCQLRHTVTIALGALTHFICVSAALSCGTRAHMHTQPGAGHFLVLAPAVRLQCHLLLELCLSRFAATSSGFPNPSALVSILRKYLNFSPALWHISFERMSLNREALRHLEVPCKV